jgi:3-phytase
VSADPDDPALWYNSRQPQDSLILGTNKVSAREGGALYAFGLNGRVVRKSEPLDRPNNVAVVGNRWAVVTERLQNRLRILRLPELEIVGEVPCGPEPMGIAAWGKDTVLISLKQSTPLTPLTRWRLRERNGVVQGTRIESLGMFSGKKEIEAIAVDSRRGEVYYADEGHGIRVWHRGRERGVLGADFTGDQEGIAFVGNCVACTEQRPLTAGGSLLHLYDRRTLRERAVFATGADETDGIEIETRPLGPIFPKGVLIAMNSGPKNFLIFDLRPILGTIGG